MRGSEVGCHTLVLFNWAAFDFSVGPLNPNNPAKKGRGPTASLPISNRSRTQICTDDLKTINARGRIKIVLNRLPVPPASPVLRLVLRALSYAETCIVPRPGNCDSSSTPHQLCTEATGKPRRVNISPSHGAGNCVVFRIASPSLIS